MVANGDPARVLLLVDPDSDLADVVARTGRAVVQLLSWSHRDLAEAFAGTAPAPGRAVADGVVRRHALGTAAGRRRRPGPAVSLESAAEVGWSRLLTCVVEEVVVGDDEAPLVHRRGRYVRPEGLMAADDLLEIADELYGLPLPEFTPARDARAKELKGTAARRAGQGAEEAVDRGLGRQPAGPPRHRAGRAGAHGRRRAARGAGVDVGRRAARAHPAAAPADRGGDHRRAADRPRGGHQGHRGGGRPGRGDADRRDGRRALRPGAAQRAADRGARQHRARPGRRRGGGRRTGGAGLQRSVAGRRAARRARTCTSYPTRRRTRKAVAAADRGARGGRGRASPRPPQPTTRRSPPSSELEARSLQLQAEIDELRSRIDELESSAEETDDELSDAEDARAEAEAELTAATEARDAAAAALAKLKG